MSAFTGAMSPYSAQISDFPCIPAANRGSECREAPIEAYFSCTPWRKRISADFSIRQRVVTLVTSPDHFFRHGCLRLLMKILACNSNRPLAEAMSRYLDLPLTKASVRRFSDMEVFVEILENVRGEDVFVVQSTSYPANDHLMELLVSLDALKRASARRVTAVIPYYGYARQDRKSGSRTPISAKLVANMITAAGANRVLTLDLHAGQIQGFFDIPTDNLYAAPVFVKDIQDCHPRQDLIIVAPDDGGVERARDIARRLDVDLAIIDKRRERAGVSEVVNIIGDVGGRRCIIIDDIVDTAGTLCNAGVALIEAGASSVNAYITHGVLSGEAVSRVDASPIETLVITDSIVATEAVKAARNIRQVTIAPLMGEAIRRISEERSVSSLFN
jgi:ribose-phosphate pyrophosphokinase